MQLIDDYPSGALPALYLVEAADRLLWEYSSRCQQRSGVHTMMDAWLGTYMLVDKRQDGAPSARSRYFTARAASIVDTSRRVLAQNPLRYRVSQMTRKADVPAADTRAGFQLFENVLHGVQYDIDRQLTSRGEMDARSQVAFHSLLRGAWAYRYQLTAAAKNITSTHAPQDYRQYDPRLVLPLGNVGGVDSAIYYTMTTLTQLRAQYPQEIEPSMARLRAFRRPSRSSTPGVGTQDWAFMYQPLLMLEWSSTTEAATMVDLSGLPDDVCTALGIDKKRITPERFFWVQQPYKHGFGRSLIQYGNVNALPITSGSTQMIERQRQMLAGPASVAGQMPGAERTSNGNFAIHNVSVLVGANGQPLTGSNNEAYTLTDPILSGAGRAIFSNVTHLLSDYNDGVSLLKDSVVQGVRGTWIVRTPNGQAMEFHPGTGEVNFMSTRDDAQKLPSPSNASDSLQLLQLINQEISDGSIDLRFILASADMAPGITRARMEQAALLALVDYKAGLQHWGVSLAETFEAQYRVAGNSVKDWKLTGKQPGSMSKYFVVDMDGKLAEILKESDQPPTIEANVKAAMPIDLMARINMAKSAIDPNNPVMGLAMALDTIMEIDDIDSVYDEILNDMGERNPTIMLFRIAEQFKKNGAPEVAQMILDDQYRSAFTNAMQAQQGQTATPTGGSPGILPENLPPEMSSGGATEQVNRGGSGAPGGEGIQLALENARQQNQLNQRALQRQRF